MSYEIGSFTVPSTVVASQPVEIAAESCCTDPDGCPLDRNRIFIDGTKVGESQTAPASDFCVTITAGEEPFDGTVSGGGSGFDVDKTDRMVTFTEPGTYTIEATVAGASKSTTITVEEPVIDPGLVTSSCSVDAPSDPVPGDQITLEGTVNNDNSAPVDVEVAFTFGNATETQTITVPAGGQETVTQAFTPDETGEFVPDVNHTIL
jgi:hypothetical protein